MIRDISSGNLMIVSDIHGNGYDFRQILSQFKILKEKGKVDYLIFLGDLIHAYPGKRKDESLQIVEELIRRKANHPESDIICLLGNHEFIHIFHIALAKGHLEFATWFENRIRKNRAEIINFFMGMPLMIRTKGGVLINHTGASDRYAYNGLLDLPAFQNFWENLEFRKHIEHIDTYNPQIGSDFMNTEMGDFLWDILMNGNEKQYGSDYLQYINQLLDLMSADRPEHPLHFLVSGHIAAEYGAAVVGKKQLRICTSMGALGDLEKKFLLMDAEKTYINAEELMEYCRDLY